MTLTGDHKIPYIRVIASHSRGDFEPVKHTVPYFCGYKLGMNSDQKGY